MKTAEHVLLLIAILGALAFSGVGALILADRYLPKQKPLVPGHADDAVLAATLAAARPMKQRPMAPGGWRETEPPELDPVEQNRLHTEVREYLKAPAP